MKDSPISEFKLEVEAKLPPWEVGGALVDLVMDHENHTICVMISFTGLINTTDEKMLQIYDHCDTVKRRLEESLPPGWRTI